MVGGHGGWGMMGGWMDSLMCQSFEGGKDNVW